MLGPKVDSNNNMDQLISQMNEERVAEEIYFLLSITCFYPIFKKMYSQIIAGRPLNAAVC